MAPDAKLMAVAVVVVDEGGTFTAGTPEALFQTNMTVIPHKQQYDVAPDDRFVIPTELEDISPEPIRLLLNWKPPEK